MSEAKPRIRLLDCYLAGLSGLVLESLLRQQRHRCRQLRPAARRRSATAGPATSPTDGRAPAEPTTTNTLPPPPPPSGPAPSTAGSLQLSRADPRGMEDGGARRWRRGRLRGQRHLGARRDPRYAAQDVIAVGCAAVTRDDYTDPTAALEGNYVNRSGDTGVGLVLEFGDEQAATGYFDLYRDQVQACTTTDERVHTAIVSGVSGLVTAAPNKTASGPRSRSGTVV